MKAGSNEWQITAKQRKIPIKNTDQRSKDYSEIENTFRPGHADITYWQKYGIRDYRGGGRSSARETASRVAAGGVARAVLSELMPDLQIQAYLTQIGPDKIDKSNLMQWDPDSGLDVSIINCSQFNDIQRHFYNSSTAITLTKSHSHFTTANSSHMKLLLLSYY